MSRWKIQTARNGNGCVSLVESSLFDKKKSTIPRGRLLFPSPPPRTKNKACHNSDHPIIEASPPFLPLDYTYTSLKILKLSRSTVLGLHWKPSGTTGCAPGVTPFSMPSQGAGGGGGRRGVDLEKRREKKKERKKKERKKQKQSSANSFSPTSRRDCPCLSARKTYSFDHPILSPPFSLITASRMWYEEETRFHTGEKGREGEEKGKETRVPLFPFLSLRRSHRGNKKESRDRKTSISKHTVGTSWISENWKSVSPWDSTTARSHRLPVFFRYLSPRLESSGNPRQTSCEESGINVLPLSLHIPPALSISLYRGTTTPLLGPPRYLRSSISS